MSIRNRIAVSLAALLTMAMLAGCETGPEVRKEAAAPQTAVAAKPAGADLPQGVTGISVDQLKELVAKGPEAGNYLLFDSRPAGRFNAATIPTSQHLTDKDMEQLDKDGKVASRLGDDKNKLVIFWCGGPT